jgi:hypothetical protein
LSAGIETVRHYEKRDDAEQGGEFPRDGGSGSTDRHDTLHSRNATMAESRRIDLADCVS